MYTLIEIALSVGVLITLITVLTVCVCGCKNSNQKSELVGTAGVVKIRFDEEVPSLTPTTPASIKRASTQNSQRSLPEIPHPVGRHDSGDTASEIYATVNLDEGNKNAEIPSTSREHRYEHAYAKLQNETHNVAVGMVPDQVSEIEIQIDEREASQSGPESVVISASVAISGQLPSSQELPYITPPSPRPHAENNVHFSGDSTDSTKGYTSISVREPLSNIRAQSAGTGGAAGAGAGAGRPARLAHYATVSDDSDEMYAAIEDASVGEGSDTYAQIAPEPRRRPTPPAAAAHPAAPADAPPAPADAPRGLASRRSAPPEMGASTSRATHSRQASTSSCSNSTGALGSPKPEKRQANSPLPPPPPAHAAPAAHAAHSAHSAHAHGAAPPPPPPHAAGAPPRAFADALRHQRILSTGDLQFNHDKLRRSFNEKHQRNNSCVSSSDFYGCNYPVEKHRFSSGELGRPLVARELDFDMDHTDRPADNLYNSIDGPEPDRAADSPSRNVDDMYAKVIKKGKTADETTANKTLALDPNDIQSKYRNDDPGYETIDRKKTNHGYETIARKQRTTSQSQDPTYETVKEVGKSGGDANFANSLVDKLNHVAAGSGPDSIAGSDPGYEHIAKNVADSEPNYEVLRNQPPTPPYATIAPNYKPQPAYSTVNKRPGKYGEWPTNNNDDPAAEPNYESMPHDPLYTTGSESDPNYESVRPKDPNYESVQNYDSFRSRDPRYESLISKDPKYDSVRSRKDPNYESVKYFEVSRSEPPYEKVKGVASVSRVDRSDSLAGYEKINVPDESQAKVSVNGADNTVVSDYFHV